MQTSNATIAIIGAGIIGVTSAVKLAKCGYKICVFDPHPAGYGGASKNNAGHIASSDIFPLSTPGIVKTGLKYLLQKNGPLKIPSIEKLRMLPWFLQFLATSRSERFQKATDAITYLSLFSVDELQNMLTVAGHAEQITRIECAYVYDCHKSLLASLDGWKKKASVGFKSNRISQELLRSQLPNLNPRLSHVVLSKNWAVVDSPLKTVEYLAEYAKRIGVKFKACAVDNITPENNGIVVHVLGTKKHFNTVVVAAGVHSKYFAEILGEKLPIVAERGYNLTFPNPGFELQLPIVFANRGIVATRLRAGLRIGGWAEYISSDRAENMHYYDDLAEVCQELFPKLNQQGAQRWMGQRPTLPDSVPVISCSSKSKHVFYNSGHGHYGLTHSAISARILAELVTEESINQKHNAYSINRFN